MTARRALERLALLTACLTAHAAVARADMQVSVIDLNHPPELRQLSHNRLEVFGRGNATVVIERLEPGIFRPPATVNREQILVFLSPVVLKKRHGSPLRYGTDDLLHRLPGDVLTGSTIDGGRPGRLISIAAQGPHNTRLSKDQAATASFTPTRLTRLRELLSKLARAGSSFSSSAVVKEGTLTASLALLRARRTWPGPSTRELLLLGISGSARLKTGDRQWALSPHVLARIPAGYPDSITLEPHGSFSVLIVASGS